MLIRPRRLLRVPTSSCSSDVAVGEDPLRPGQHPLALGRQALEAVAALDDQDAEILLQMAQSGRQGRLRHAAGLRCPREVSLAGEADEVAELADVHQSVFRDSCRRGRAALLCNAQ